MKVVQHTFKMASRSEAIRLYVLGDVHIGARNCAEDEFMLMVRRIAKDPQAYWIGGGDYCDAVILKDAKRFDVNTLPNWMLTGNPKTIRERVGDILSAQRHRFCDLVDPIKDKCLGLIEGNHEYSIFKYHNRDHMSTMAEMLGSETLTDAAFLRLKFLRQCKSIVGAKHKKGEPEGQMNQSRVYTVFICHGHGGGRTSGAEPNKLYRLAADKQANIILTGHSHTFCIHPPIPMLSIPSRGRLPENPTCSEKHAANWGCYMYAYRAGPSTYDSRANYPVRPMYTVETVILPHKGGTTSAANAHASGEITMNEIRM